MSFSISEFLTLISAESELQDEVSLREGKVKPQPSLPQNRETIWPLRSRLELVDTWRREFQADPVAEKPGLRKCLSKSTEQSGNDLRRNLPMSAQARVIGVFIDYPYLTDKEIAEKAGCHRSSLYRMEKFKKMKEMRQADGLGRRRRGFKVKKRDGSIEVDAIADDIDTEED
jgi:hypothetical protein